jgi:hypothetical protein
MAFASAIWATLPVVFHVLNRDSMSAVRRRRPIRRSTCVRHPSDWLAAPWLLVGSKILVIEAGSPYEDYASAQARRSR